jgi:hypothetical protein
MSQTNKSSLKSKLSIRCIHIAGDHVPSPKNTPPSIERRAASRSGTPKQQWKFKGNSEESVLTSGSINAIELKVK